MSPYAGEAPKFWAEAYDTIGQWRAHDVLYLGDSTRGPTFPYGVVSAYRLE